MILMLWTGRRRGVMTTAIDLNRATTAEIQALLERSLAKDNDALNDLLRGIAPTIQVRVARALLRRRSQSKGRDLRADVEDLVQEVFAALFASNARALRAWDPARGLTFLGFVGFIAEREVGMIMRTGKRCPWTEDPTMDDKLSHLRGSAPSHEDRVMTRELLERMAEHLLERLTPQGRHYFQLLYVEARPVQAIAQETGMSPDALYAWRSRLGRLLRDLKEELAREELEHV